MNVKLALSCPRPVFAATQTPRAPAPDCAFTFCQTNVDLRHLRLPRLGVVSVCPRRPLCIAMVCIRDWGGVSRLEDHCFGWVWHILQAVHLPAQNDWLVSRGGVVAGHIVSNSDGGPERWCACCPAHACLTVHRSSTETSRSTERGVIPTWAVAQVASCVTAAGYCYCRH